MKTKTIKQTVTFKASPHDVYEALMDSKKHAEFTGGKATISREVGGSFTAHGTYVNGKNLELVPNKKIVQSWTCTDFPAGYYSKVTFVFTPDNGGTKLTFMHENVPEEDFKNIAQGWIDYYWEPMKKLLE